GPELLLEPGRHGPEKRPKRARSRHEVRVEEALELQERLVVKDDVIDLSDRNSGFRKAVFDRTERQRRVVTLPREALFLGRGDDLAVTKQASGAIVIERGKAEDVSRQEAGSCHLRRVSSRSWARGPARTPLRSD